LSCFHSLHCVAPKLVDAFGVRRGPGQLRSDRTAKTTQDSVGGDVQSNQGAVPVLPSCRMGVIPLSYEPFMWTSPTLPLPRMLRRTTGNSTRVTLRLILSLIALEVCAGW